jgi:hypothetical protein
MYFEFEKLRPIFVVADCPATVTGDDWAKMEHHCPQPMVVQLNSESGVVLPGYWVIGRDLPRATPTLPL